MHNQSSQGVVFWSLKASLSKTTEKFLRILDIIWCTAALRALRYPNLARLQGFQPSTQNDMPLSPEIPRRCAPHASVTFFLQKSTRA